MTASREIALRISDRDVRLLEDPIEKMTDEELGLSEDAALNTVADGHRIAKYGLDRARDIRIERFRRECARPKRKGRGQ